MSRIRKDIASLGGVWSDTMTWYANAVGAMRAKPISDRTSWTYLAAIHGFDQRGWAAQSIIPSFPDLPSGNEQRLMFNQCQHAGWFFLPWHRGYLHAFEAILASWIESQGGPSDWALPYWNYLNAGNATARDIPQEFLDPTYDGGKPNPLATASRGPATSLGTKPWIPVDITLNAQSETFYTSDPGGLGYGGPISGFAQQGNAYGANESDPHNLVHVMVGGGKPVAPQGWMFDPNFAALDPIFWVHHCNVDRLWAAWMDAPGHTQENSQPWLNGPFPRQFMMPNPAGGVDVFVPGETLPGQPLEPMYDKLVHGTGKPPAPASGGLGVRGTAVSKPPASRLIGTNDTDMTLGADRVSSRLAIKAPARSPGLGVAAARRGGKRRVFLSVEGVKGEVPTAVLTVVLTPAGADPAAAPEEAKKTLVFFGLGNATSAEGPHGGSGLTQTVDITDIAASLMDGDEIEAHLQRSEDSDVEVKVERLSVHVREED
ncbi:MAG: tyrosinase family protein [Pseudomonadota bacterium]